ncbi:MAG: hypothetical protein ACM3YE_13505 [Bacteroidota bacterium]
MTMQLMLGTVIVILVIFAFFFYAAYRADQAVEAKAAAKRRAMVKTGSKAKKG